MRPKGICSAGNTRNYEHEFAMTFSNHTEKEKNLNSNILKITMMIKEQYPELCKYLEEMPITIPDEKNPEITVMNLQKYYDSLNLLFNNYTLEHPRKA